MVKFYEDDIYSFFFDYPPLILTCVHTVHTRASSKHKRYGNFSFFNLIFPPVQLYCKLQYVLYCKIQYTYLQNVLYCTHIYTVFRYFTFSVCMVAFSSISLQYFLIFFLCFNTTATYLSVLSNHHTVIWILPLYFWSVPLSSCSLYNTTHRFSVD